KAGGQSGGGEKRSATPNERQSLERDGRLDTGGHESDRSYFKGSAYLLCVLAVGNNDQERLGHLPAHVCDQPLVLSTLDRLVAYANNCHFAVGRCATGIEWNARDNRLRC